MRIVRPYRHCDSCTPNTWKNGDVGGVGGVVQCTCAMLRGMTVDGVEQGPLSELCDGVHCTGGLRSIG